MLNMKTKLSILLYEKSGKELLDEVFQLVNESYSEGYEIGFNHAMNSLYPRRDDGDCTGED